MDLASFAPHPMHIELNHLYSVHVRQDDDSKPIEQGLYLQVVRWRGQCWPAREQKKLRQEGQDKEDQRWKD